MLDTILAIMLAITPTQDANTDNNILSTPEPNVFQQVGRSKGKVRINYQRTTKSKGKVRI